MAKLLAASSKRAHHDDDGKPLETVTWPIAGLIDAPKGWDTWGDWNDRYSKDDQGKLALDLLPQEQIYLATKPAPFARRPIQVSRRSCRNWLEKSLGEADHCWDNEILALAGREAAMLKRAGQAAALSAIGRAIYAAQVETLKETRDKRPQPSLHRAALNDAIEQWGKQAARLDMDLFLAEIGHLPPAVEVC